MLVKEFSGKRLHPRVSTLHELRWVFTGGTLVQIAIMCSLLTKDYFFGAAAGGIAAGQFVLAILSWSER